MIYKGFSILHSRARGWYIIISVFEEWLATSKEDAMRQVDDYYNRKVIAA